MHRRHTAFFLNGVGGGAAFVRHRRHHVWEGGPWLPGYCMAAQAISPSAHWGTSRVAEHPVVVRAQGYRHSLAPCLGLRVCKNAGPDWLTSRSVRMHGSRDSHVEDSVTLTRSFEHGAAHWKFVVRQGELRCGWGRRSRAVKASQSGRYLVGTLERARQWGSSGDPQLGERQRVSATTLHMLVRRWGSTRPSVRVLRLCHKKPAGSGKKNQSGNEILQILTAVLGCCALPGPQG